MTSGGDANQAPIFDRYAGWYDAFNKGKDYDAEAAYLLDVVRRSRPFPTSWLDVGCGTGNHVAALRSSGVAVEGVDISPSMIARARAAHPDIAFHVGSAQEFQLSGGRDVVSVLFHAMSYQTTDEAVRAAFGNMSAHLGAGGLLLFDYWHTEAVLRDPPASRVREATVDARQLFRITHPIEDRDRHLINVHFEFRWDSPTGSLAHKESHAMRHFDAAELTGFLQEAGFGVVSSDAWMQNRALRPDDWYGLICAAKE